MTELSDADVFGSAAPRELTDAEVFSQPAQDARVAAAARVKRPGRDVPQYGREAPASTWGDVGDTLKRVPAQFNQGLAQTAGRALDVVPYFVDRAMGGEGVHPVENTIKKYTVPDYGPPQSYPQELADSAGKMMGETAPYAAGGAGLFTRMVKPAIDAAPTVANAFRNAFSRLGETMAKRPVATITGENVAAAESGGVGEHMRQTAEHGGAGPTGQHVAETVGQTFGPAALQVAPAMLVAKASKPLISMAARGAESVAGAVPENVRPAWLDSVVERGEQARQQAARGAVSDKLGSALATPESQAGLAEVEKLKQQIPGFNPGTARATADPELLNTQQSLDTAATGDKLRQGREAFDKSKGAIADKFENTVPAAGDNPEDTVANVIKKRVAGVTGKIEDAKSGVQTRIGERETELQGRLQKEGTDTQALIDTRQADAQMNLERQRGEARGRIREISDSLPQVDRIEGGEVMRTARAGAQEAMDRETTRLRRQIANPGRVVEIEPARPATATTPEVPAVTMTINQVLNRRASINQEMRDYSNASARTVDDVRAIRRLQAEKDHLDGVINDINEPGMSDYVNHYKNENVPQFRQGASAEVGQRDSFGYGGNRVDPEQVGRKFFNPNEESAARQFQASMGHDPAARQQMIDNALDDIRHTAIDPTTGMLREGAVAKWLQKNERVLNEVPFVRDAVMGRNPDPHYSQLTEIEQGQRLAGNPKTAAQVDPEIGNLQTKAAGIAEQQKLAANSKTAGQLDPELPGMHERIGQLEQRQRKVADTKLAQVLERMTGPGQGPENAISAALNDHVLMKQMMNSARGEPVAEAAVRRAVFESVRKTAPDALTNPANFLEWLNGHRRPLSAAFTPQHLADLEAVAKASIVQNRLGRPEGTVAVPKSIVGTIEDALGVTVGSAASTSRGVAQGRTSLPIEAATQAGKFLNRQTSKASMAAWEEALANPEAAKMVANIVRTKATGRQLEKMRAYLLTSGVMHAEGRDNAPQE